MKRCSDCHQEKDESQFFFDSYHGRHKAYCKSCSADRTRRYRSEGPIRDNCIVLEDIAAVWATRAL